MSAPKYATWKKFLIIPAIAVGVGAVVLAKSMNPGPEQRELQEAATKVRVIDAPVVNVIPRALGYGHVEPGKVWEAIAEVKGRVVDIHPRLKKGAILAAGTELLRLDATDYQLKVAEIEATVRSVRAQISELATKEKNTRASLRIDTKSLDLSAKDLERKQRLFKNKTVSQSAVDQEERNVLARRQSVQNLRNSLNLIPAERDVLRAQLALSQAQLDAAVLDLDRTVIIAPFDCRIAEVNVEKTQYAAQGKVLVIADGLAVAENEAQVPLERMIDLMPKQVANPFDTVSGTEDLTSVLGLSAQVRLSGGGVQATWKARFARMSDTVDPKTRTVGVIVAVDDPYKKTIPGVRPPLTKNMFVEVELRGQPLADKVVIPRVALHAGKVYVATADNRLQIRSVKTAFRQTNFAVIDEGLSAGERVIVSDLIPAIDGMLLTPTADQSIIDGLVREATGVGEVR